MQAELQQATGDPLNIPSDNVGKPSLTRHIERQNECDQTLCEMVEMEGGGVDPTTPSQGWTRAEF